MKKQYLYQNGYGGLGMFFAGTVIASLLFFFIFPEKFSRPHTPDSEKSKTYCRSIINDPDAPTVTAPSYTGNEVQTNNTKTYRLIKKTVPINHSIYINTEKEHFFNSFKENYEDPTTGDKFIMRLPKGEQGRSYKLPSEVGTEDYLVFADYGLLYLFQTNDNYELVIDKLDIGGGSELEVVFADIYKAIDTPELPEWVLTCEDAGTNGSIEGIVYKQNSFYYPEQNWSVAKKEEQLGYFLFKNYTLLLQAWWTPHCKPAVYLYPEKQMKINVKVGMPSGSFLYTDPIYPSDGWHVTAYPNGDIQYSGNLKDSKGIVSYPSGIFPYLYYEARISDSAIDKPTQGYVRKYEDMEAFYNEILPKLGLNEKETNEFKQYWLKALPKSPYYFIGIVPKSNLDTIEPLTITPKQDTTIRVSLYFEPLDQFQIIQPPTIHTPQRSGFTVVEWGGMLKRDENHPFTCVE